MDTFLDISFLARVYNTQPVQLTSILHQPNLVPRPLPDFISHHGCEIKSGSGLGTRLTPTHTQVHRMSLKLPGDESRTAYKDTI